MSWDQVLFELGDLSVTTGRFTLALLAWIAFGVLAFVGAARMDRRLRWPGTSGGNTVLLLLNGFRVKMIGAGLLVALAIVGVRVLPLVGVILALGAIAALTFRSTFEQMWAGLLILWERPFSLGERILVGEYEGEVERVGLRATTLRSEERMAIHVPNAYLTRHAIHNRSKTEGGFGLRIPVEVLASSDSGEVISALRKAAERNNRVRSSPSPKAFMMGFTTRGIQFELRAWVDAYNDALWATNELCRAIQSEFQRAGIQLVSERSGARGITAGVPKGRPRRLPESEGEAGRSRESEPSRSRESEPSRSREREAGRSRERETETPREPRSDRQRSERPPGRDRRPPSRDAESSPHRRGRRTPEPVLPPAGEETSMTVEPVSPHAGEDALMPMQVEPALRVEPAEEDFLAMTDEPAREEFPAPGEPESYLPTAETPGALEPAAPETPRAFEPATPETPSVEEPAPSFGRSKRRVPRR